MSAAAGGPTTTNAKPDGGCWNAWMRHDASAVVCYWVMFSVFVVVVVLVATATIRINWLKWSTVTFTDLLTITQTRVHTTKHVQLNHTTRTRTEHNAHTHRRTQTRTPTRTPGKMQTLVAHSNPSRMRHFGVR